MVSEPLPSVEYRQLHSRILMGVASMRRRECITLLGGAAMAWPFAACSEGATPVIGFIGLETSDVFAARLREFHKGLGEHGYVEGQNVTTEYRWAEGHYDRIPGIAADLVLRNVAVIVAPNTAAALASKAATTKIPVIFNTSGDPIALGLVASLNRPGGNATGVASLGAEIASKRLQLLHELVPGATTFGLLVTQQTVALEDAAGLQAAAGSLGLKLHVLRAGTMQEIDTAFATMPKLGIEGLVISTDAFFSNRLDQIAALAARYSLPAITQYRAFASSGGLMSYGTSLFEVYRLLGLYVARVLKGDKPADLPVQQATKIEMIINAKTARTLGIAVPLSLLGRADEVIE